MNINGIDSTNFSGYKNILAKEVCNNKGLKFTALTVQLNNDGAKDLDKWHEIQSALFKNRTPEDAVTIFLIKQPDTYDFCVNARLLSCTSNNAMFIKSEEPFVLKLYTLLSDITKRICEAEIPHNDIDAQKIVATAMLRNIAEMFGNKWAVSITNNAVFLESDSRIKRSCAEEINKSISKIMEDYFA